MIKKIESIANWLKWEQWFKENGYKPWQYQYHWQNKEGFHTWFMKAECDDIEIVTHNKEIYDLIFHFKQP